MRKIYSLISCTIFLLFFCMWGQALRHAGAQGMALRADVNAPQQLATSAQPNRYPPQSYMDSLERIKKQDGRDNALIHYTLAAWAMPKTNELPESEMMKAILKEGWGTGAVVAQAAIDRCQMSFLEVRKGAALDYAKGIGIEKGAHTPVPNFLAAQMLAKMLCIQGRLFEQKGKPADALDNYLTVLTTGRDFSSAGNDTLISFLISVAVDNIALTQIHQLVVSGKLTKPDLQRTLARLKEIERTQGTIKAAQAEGAITKAIFRQIKENPKISIENHWVSANADIPKMLEEAEKTYDKVRQVQSRYLAQPYWQRDKAAYERECATMMSDPIAKNFIPDYAEADIRYQIMISKLRQTQLATAVETMKLEKGKCPETLNELAPTYFAVLPFDPFTGKPFVYKTAAEGKQFYDYGLGPDQLDQRCSPLYDPTNGTLSPGDILMIP